MERIAPGSPQALRESNLTRVFDAVRARPGTTHAELSRSTGLSPASITNIVRVLAESGRVEVSDAVVAGRKCRVVRPTPTAGLVAAIDIGRSHVSACLATLSRDVLVEHHESLAPEATAAEGIALSCALIDRMVIEAGTERSQIRAAVVGVPGPLDEQSGHIGAGTLLPRWTGTDLPSAFTAALGLPVTVENDANLGALGEYCWPPGLADEVTDLVYLRLTTGIGAGLIIGGQLYRGVAGTAGEIGHVTVDERGPMCRCGNRGCLETFAAVPRMLTHLESVLGRPMTVPAWVAAVHEGDPASCRMVEDMGRFVGMGVANLCNLMNPAQVLIGGPIVAVGDLLLDAIRDVVRRRAIPSAASHVAVGPAQFGPRSELYGAIGLAIEQVERATAE